jgi:hypothetical protein
MTNCSVVDDAVKTRMNAAVAATTYGKPATMAAAASVGQARRGEACAGGRRGGVSGARIRAKLGE